jgi:hypothetical protein
MVFIEPRNIKAVWKVVDTLNDGWSARHENPVPPAPPAARLKFLAFAP